MLRECHNMALVFSSEETRQEPKVREDQLKERDLN